jgi:hypothetical protein
MGNSPPVEVFPDALRQTNGVLLADSPFQPRTRLIHISWCANEFQSRIESFGIESKILQEGPRFIVEDDQPRPGIWVGEPITNLIIALRAIDPPEPEPGDPQWPSHAWKSIVLVHDVQSSPSSSDAPLNIAEIPGLIPYSHAPRSDWVPRSHADFNQGISVAVTGNEIWLGSTPDPRGIIGGLWMTSDSGKTWTRFAQSRERPTESIASLLANYQTGRLLYAVSPKRWRAAAQSNKHEAAIWDRPGHDGDFLAFTAIPLSDESDVQLCGWFSDGSIGVRVGESAYRVGPYNLFRLIFGLD